MKSSNQNGIKNVLKRSLIDGTRSTNYPEFYSKTIDELSRIRSLIEEQNNQINWGPIVALMSVFFSAIIYAPNFGVLISITFLVMSFTIFLCRKNIQRYNKLMTMLAHLFVIVSIILLILSLYYDFYVFLMQPLSIKKSKRNL